VKVLLAIMPPLTLPSEADVTLSVRLLFTLVATLLAAICSVAFAWQASGVDPNEALKEGGRRNRRGTFTACAGHWW